MSNHDLITRVAEIEQKHGVIIKADYPLDPLKQHSLNGLLNMIDTDLEKCPQYMKDNIGPILIEDSFDEIGIEGILLIGYVDDADFWENYPIHIKIRSVLDKILFFTPLESGVFLHEAAHSFEFNIKAEISNKWEDFHEAFSQVQTHDYDTSALLWYTLLPIIPRPTSMSSLYGNINHYEDFAETYRYLKQNNIELIKDKDPILYKKCKMVEAFTTSGSITDM